jgi:RNA polymerase sigma-70 factor, ECF subfamily
MARHFHRAAGIYTMEGRKPRHPDTRMTREEESDLISRVLAGERQAYAGLVRTHHQEVLRLCRSLLGNQARAEDAAQESFLRAYKSLRGYEGRASFLTWLSRIASNLCLEMLRKEHRRREDSWDALVEERGEAACGLLREPEEAGQALERRDIVGRLLGELSPENRLVLTLRELNGYTYEEIARTMECTLDSVKARLRRARLDIIERLRIIDGCRVKTEEGTHGTR